MELGWLEINNRGGPQQELHVTKSPLTIGRAGDNDLVLKESSVSPYHAQIIADGEGWHLLDLASANGTYVDGERVDSQLPHRLADLTTIRIGTVRLVAHPLAVPAGAASTPPEDVSTPSRAAEAPLVAARPDAEAPTEAVVAPVILPASVQAAVPAPAGTGAPARAPLHLTLNPTELATQVGQPVTTAVSVVNRSTIVDRVTFAVEGLPPGWATISPPNLALFPGAQGEAHVAISPPRDARSIAGSRTFAVVAHSALYPESPVAVPATLTLAPYAEFHAELDPQIQPARLRTSYRLDVVNRGNAPQVFQLEGKDEGNELILRIKPTALTLAPGEAGTALVRARVRTSKLIGRPKPYSFTVQVASSDSSIPPRPLMGRLIYEPFIRPWVLGLLLLGVVGLALLPALLPLLGIGSASETTASAADQAARTQTAQAEAGLGRPTAIGAGEAGAGVADPAAARASGLDEMAAAQPTTGADAGGTDAGAPNAAVAAPTPPAVPTVDPAALQPVPPIPAPVVAVAQAPPVVPTTPAAGAEGPLGGLAPPAADVSPGSGGQDQAAAPAVAGESEAAEPAETVQEPMVPALQALVSPAASTTCPAQFTFMTIVSANVAGTIPYQWERSDGVVGPAGALTFEAPGSKTVTATWSLVAAPQSGGGWARVRTMGPSPMVSNDASFTLNCPTPAPSATTTPTSTGGEAGAATGPVAAVSAAAKVAPAASTTCPAMFTFTAEITASAPGTLSYIWERSDGTTTPQQDVRVTGAGPAKVMDTWSLGTSGMNYTGWARVRTLGPDPIVSEPASFTVNCPSSVTGVKARVTLGRAQPTPAASSGLLTAAATNDQAEPLVSNVYCPAMYSFVAEITVDGPGPVRYRWEASDGTIGPEQSLTFSAAGSQTVNDTWTVGQAGERVTGGKRLRILAPNSLVSDEAAFSLACGTTATRAEARVSTLAEQKCPATFRFAGAITVNGPGTIRYRWDRGPGIETREGELAFTAAGTKLVPVDEWVLDRPGVPFNGSVRLQVVSPNSIESAPVTFTLNCPASVSAVTAQVSPSQAVTCPAKFTVAGQITTNGPGQVTYQWERSAGPALPEVTVQINAAGTQAVTHTWDLNSPGKNLTGWVRLRIIRPTAQDSEPTNFTLNCPASVTDVRSTVTSPPNPVCPMDLNVVGEITMNGPGAASYRWERSDGTMGSEMLLVFDDAGTQKVTDTWKLDIPGTTYSGWGRLHILAPEPRISNAATFSVNCAADVTSVTVGATPAASTTCPRSFYGDITMSGPGTVEYRWEVIGPSGSNSTPTPVQPLTITFEQAGTKRVTMSYSWPSGTNGTAVIRLYTLKPNQKSGEAMFELTCGT